MVYVFLYMMGQFVQIGTHYFKLFTIQECGYLELLSASVIN